MSASASPARVIGPVVLEVTDVHTYYGNIHALQGVSITVREREIVTLLGSNGAGKSTTLKTISGLLRPRLGTVKLRGRASTTSRRTRSFGGASANHPKAGTSFRACRSMRTWRWVPSSTMTPNRSRSIGNACSTSSPDCASAFVRKRARYPVVNSKCWRSGAR